MSKQISSQLAQFNEPLTMNTCDVPLPQLGQVLVKVKYCGVCHSDLHILEGKFKLGDKQVLDLRNSTELPRTLGHEVSGIVEKIGDKVTNVKVGDRVALYPVLGCGECSKCESQQENLCSFQKFFGSSVDGGFSTHILCSASQAVPISSSDDIFAAICCCSGITTYSAIKKLGKISDEDRILFIGAGGLGLMALQIFRALYPSHPGPIMADIDQVKLDVALKNGASDTINLNSDTTFLLENSQTAWIGQGLSGIIDFVGSGTTVAQFTPTLNRGGILVVVGLFGGAATIPVPLLPLRGITVVGNYLGTLTEFKELIDLLEKGALQSPPVQIRSLSQAYESLLDLQKGRVAGRIVLKVDQVSSL